METRLSSVSSMGYLFMKYRSIVLLFIAGFSFHNYILADPSDAQAVKEFLSGLPAEVEWQEWLKENGPIYGNYCGLEEIVESFEAPCLSRLDCICKARQFGFSLQKFSKADLSYLERNLGITLSNKTQPRYEILFRIMTAKMFAARQIGVDISDGLISAYKRFEKDPQEALANLDIIIDENEVYRKKIEEINIERLRHEDKKREDEKEIVIWQREMAVSMHPFHLIFGLFYLNYEYKFASNFSLRLGTSIFATGLIADTYLGYANDNKNFSTFLTFGVKSFVSGQALSSGMYLEPVLEVGSESVKRATGTLRDRDIAFVPALLFGFEKVFFSGILLDFALGGGLHVGIPVSDTDFTTTFLVPKIRVSLGFAW